MNKKDKFDLMRQRLENLMQPSAIGLPNIIDAKIKKFASGGNLAIKPSKRGAFTKKAKGAGSGVQQYARHVLANKEDFSTETIKQAVYAKNIGGSQIKKKKKK